MVLGPGPRPRGVPSDSPEWAGPNSAGSLIAAPANSRERLPAALHRSSPALPRRSSAACAVATCRATPQRVGEAAWHRRARRQRGAARTLLRVAAAAGIVARHHASGATASMGGGRGRGGDGAAAGSHGARWSDGIDKILHTLQQQSEQQQQLLRALGSGGAARMSQQHGGKGGGFKGKDARGQAGKGGGGSGKGGEGLRRDRSRPAGAGMRARAGDWQCAGCNAFPCFASTSACFRCGRPRRNSVSSVPHGRGKNGGRGLSDSASPSSYLGPIGAGGSRPLLGGRGAAAAKADTPPTQRVPGASVAARAEEARRQRDDDGEWQVARAVRPRRAPGDEAAPPAAASVPSTSPAAATATRNSWAALLEEEQEGEAAVQQDDGDEEDATVDDDMGSWHDDGGEGDHSCQDGEAGPTEAELKAAWQNHCAAYRRLERGQPPAPPGVLAAVRAQRDEAESAWRAARTPHPLHKRLRWAENELRSAEAKEAARRAELDEHLEQAARRTRDLQAMLNVDAARTARKRSALRSLHQEGAQDLDHLPEIGKAARVAITGIGSDIAPALTAIIEQLGDEHQAIRQDLQLLSTSLGHVEGVLRDAADGELAKVHQQRLHDNRPSVFDISDNANPRDDGGMRGDGGGSNGRGVGETDQTAAAVDRAASAAAATQRWTRPAPNAPWRKAATSSSVGAVEEARQLLRAAAAGTSAHAPTISPSQTNDLQVAERLEREHAMRQQQEAMQRQKLVQQDSHVAELEEQRRLQREQSRVEELHRHQEAAQRAAEAAAAEEARHKEERWASLSPEEREQARKLHAQQAAVGAHIFGSQEAGQMAGLVHQSHVRESIQEDAQRATGWDEAEVQQLMGMSPEDFARWDQERQSLM